MGATFPPIILPPGALAYKRSNRVALSNLNGVGACLVNTLGSSCIDTTNNSFDSRSLKTPPVQTGGVVDLVLKFPGFAQTTGNFPTSNLPTPFNVTAALEYPIGTTPVPFFFKGQSSGTVLPGPFYLETDPLPTYIPVGANFAIKCHGTWTPGTFIFGLGLSSTQQTVEWTIRGTGLADNTLSLTSFTSTTNGVGYCPLVYGTPVNRCPVLGILGDSISVGRNDNADSLTWAPGWCRALRNQIGTLNLSIGGSSTSSWLQQMNGTTALFADSITHLLYALGTNDLTGGITFAQLQANFLRIITPFLARGLPVYAVTLMPHTTSGNGFVDFAGQTIFAGESVRQQWNAYLRTQWQQIGLSGYFDLDLTINPQQNGMWGFDAGVLTPVPSVFQIMLVPTLDGNGTITALNPVRQQNGLSSGQSYVANAVIPWVAQPYNGVPGSGGSGTITIGSGGQYASSSIISGGSGHEYPPLINITSAWTLDGLHPSIRGYNQLFGAGTFGPGSFKLS